MPTKIGAGWKFQLILWAQFFLALGFLSSPTIVSLYDILMFVPALVIFFCYRTIKIPLSSWFLLGLTTWGVISTVVNYDELVKPMRSFQEMQYYLFAVLFIPALKYFYDQANDFQIRRFLGVVYFVVVMAFIVGVTKVYFGFDLVKMKAGNFGDRSGGFTNYMRYGYASAFIFLFSVGFHLHQDRMRALLNPTWFRAGSILSLLAIFTSKTRGALLALIVGLPFLFYRYKPRLAKILLGVGGIFITVVILISLFSNAKIRFFDINDGSNKKRMSQFYSAIKSIQERPVLGLGADQFSYHVPRLKEKYDIWSKDYQGHSHNIFLEHAANYGLVGLFFFLGFLFTWAKDMLARRDHFGWIVASYILAFIVSGQVESLFDNTNTHLIFYVYSVSYALPVSRFFANKIGAAEAS